MIRVGFCWVWCFMVFTLKKIHKTVDTSVMISKISGFGGAIAQLGERNTGSVEVSGSIPLSSTN